MTVPVTHDRKHLLCHFILKKIMRDDALAGTLEQNFILL